MRSYDDFQHHLGQRLHGIGQTQAQQLVQALATAVDAQMPVDNFLREPPAMQPHFHALRQAVRSNNWQSETITAELDALTALEQQHGNGDTELHNLAFLVLLDNWMLLQEPGLNADECFAAAFASAAQYMDLADNQSEADLDSWLDDPQIAAAARRLEAMLSARP